MVTYDIECQVTFENAVPREQQVALKKSAGGHSGWYGPTPIVNWQGPGEALVLLVAKSESTGEDAAAELCRGASEQITSWIAAAGLTAGSADGLAVRCEAKPRV